MPRDKTGHFYYAWFPTIYAQDTQHLTLTEDGAYRRLIDHYMVTRAPLPSSDRSLARIVGCDREEWEKICLNVMAFFKAENGSYHHRMCDEIISGDTARILKAQMNGHKGGRPSSCKQTVITHSVSPTQNNPKQPKTKQTILNQPKGSFDGGGGGKGAGWFIPTLETADRLRQVAYGWDQHALVDKYNHWQEGKDRPLNHQAAFLGWVRNFTKDRMPS